MTFPKDYNPTDARDILRYAKWLIGKTFYDVLETDLQEANPEKTVSEYNNHDGSQPILQDPAAVYGNIRRKGGFLISGPRTEGYPL